MGCQSVLLYCSLRTETAISVHQRVCSIASLCCYQDRCQQKISIKKQRAMKKQFLILLISLLVLSCKKDLIGDTKTELIQMPWTDSSSRHPKNILYRTLIEKYQKKGLPGISLLINDAHGTWVGATGFADLENKVPFSAGQVSQVASITKIITGALVFKLMEDSINSGLSYNDLNNPITTWLPGSVTGKIANGNLVTL